MTLHHLPVPPPRLRHLTNLQSEQVDKVFRTRKPWWCMTCRDTRKFVWFTPHTERDLSSVGEYECACGDQFLLRRRFLYSGITEAWQKVSWDDFTWASDAIMEACVEYLENSDRYIHAGLGLCLSGTGGNGKTMAAMLLGKALVLEGHDVYANTFAAMLDAFADGWKDREDRRWFNQRVRNASVLIIDDLGKERNKGAESLGVNALEEVLRHRVQRDLPTIMTSNLAPQKLRDGYGGSTASLMVEKVLTVEVNGHDRRSDKAERDLAELRAGLTRPVMM